MSRESACDNSDPKSSPLHSPGFSDKIFDENARHSDAETDATSITSNSDSEFVSDVDTDDEQDDVGQGDGGQSDGEQGDGEQDDDRQDDEGSAVGSVSDPDDNSSSAANDNDNDNDNDREDDESEHSNSSAWYDPEDGRDLNVSPWHGAEPSRCPCRSNWDALKTAVLAACAQVWPDVSPTAFTFEMPDRLHRHDSADIIVTEEQERRRYRFTRFWKCNRNYTSRRSLGDWVSHLDAAPRHPEIPIQKIRAFDLSPDNKQLAWVMIGVLPGEYLSDVIRNLNHAQKLSLAKRIGQIYRTIVESGSSLFTPEPGPSSHYQTHCPGKGSPLSRCPMEGWSTTRRWLTAELREQLWGFTMRGAQDILDHLLQMSEQMDQLGLFEEDRYILWPDRGLRDYSLLVVVEGDEVKISCIHMMEDWTFASPVPLWAVCKPPNWLWAWKLETLDVRVRDNATMLPAIGQENQAIQKAFFDAAGPVVERYARPEYGHARALLKAALAGYGTIWACVERRRMEAWEPLFHELVEELGPCTGSFVPLAPHVTPMASVQHLLSEDWIRNLQRRWKEFFTGPELSVRARSPTIIPNLLDRLAAKLRCRYIHAESSLPMSTRASILQARREQEPVNWYI